MKTGPTKQPTTLQELNIEIDKVEKQLNMIKASEDVLLKRLNELKKTRSKIHPDELIGTEFFGYNGERYRVTGVTAIISTGVDFVYWSNVLENGTLGKKFHCISKESFINNLNDGIYTKINA